MDITQRLRRWTISTDAVPASDIMDEAADEIERLRAAIRLLADQDATLSVQGGNVTVAMDCTLTDEEREALEQAISRIEHHYQPGRAVVLRAMLKRLC